MASILVQGESGKATAVIFTEISDDDEPMTYFRCLACSTKDTDRGNFEDTVQAAEIHVDMRCQWLAQ